MPGNISLSLEKIWAKEKHKKNLLGKEVRIGS